MKATLSFVVAKIAVLSLDLFANHGSTKAPIRLLLTTYSCVAITLFSSVAIQNCAICAFKSLPWTFLAYIYFACNAQYSINLMRNSNKARFGTDSRLISIICSVIAYFSVTIFVAAICCYIAQKYSGIGQPHLVDQLLLWGIAVISWYHPTMVVAANYSYRNLAPIESSEQALSKRIIFTGDFNAVFIASEIHGAVLELYPPTKLQDMFGILGVGLIIGYVYYQIASPHILILQEPNPK